jgi:hypothetical protein
MTRTQEGDHTVAQITDERTGRIGFECWADAAGQIDRPTGPAEIYRHGQHDQPTDEKWRRKGVLHRDGGPAWIQRDPDTGVSTLELWYSHGILTRDDGPAVIERDGRTGTVTHVIWVRNARQHREDAPAETWRASDAMLVREEWWSNGVLRQSTQHKGSMPLRRGISQTLTPNKFSF